MRRPASGHVVRREVTALPRAERALSVAGHDSGQREIRRGIARGAVRADSGLDERDDVDAVDEPPFGWARPER